MRFNGERMSGSIWTPASLEIHIVQISQPLQEIKEITAGACTKIGMSDEHLGK